MSILIRLVYSFGGGGADCDHRRDNMVNIARLAVSVDLRWMKSPC